MSLIVKLRVKLSDVTLGKLIHVAERWVYKLNILERHKSLECV